MNRRGFIGKAMAALAGLFGAIHFASANEGVKREASGITTGLGINFYDLAGLSVSFTAGMQIVCLQPHRHVLVMESWWTPERFEHFHGDSLAIDVRSAKSSSYLDGTTGLAFYYLAAPLQDGWENPRVAHTWREMQFEELRKGDHFRLIDEVPQGIKSTGNEDGKTVSVALEDAYNYRKGDPDAWSVAVDVKHDYPGMGAGFDRRIAWYNLVWPYSPHSLQPVAESNPKSPRTYPYSFGRDSNGYAIVREGTH